MKQMLFRLALYNWAILTGASYLAHLPAALAQTAKKHLVVIAGTPSHKAGEHEYNAGALLIRQWLANAPDLTVTVSLNGWPADTTLVPRADGIVLFMDGKNGHLALRPEFKRQLQKAVSRGAGIAALHYAVTLPAGNGDPLLDMLGGFKEDGYSAHGFWTSDFRTIPAHPVTQGVKPFQLYDECYFFLRFRPQVRTILSATPPDSVRNTPASRNAPGRPEIVSWVYERPDGGRSFGNTALHFHQNWANENLRKLVLNALRWICRLDVPAGGVVSSVTPEDLKKNLDKK